LEKVHRERLFFSFLWGKLIKKRKQLDNTLQNNAYSVVRSSYPSEHSYPSYPSEGDEKANYADDDLTRPYYADSQDHSYPVSEPVETAEGAKKPDLTRVTTLTMDMEKTNRDIAEKLYQDLLHVPTFQDKRHRWQVAGSQFSPADSLSFMEYTRRVKACIDAGGTRLDAVLPEIRRKLAQRDIA
jgi:hypothetical protein